MKYFTKREIRNRCKSSCINILDKILILKELFKSGRINLGEYLWQNGKLPKYKPGNRNNTKGGMCMTDYEIIMIFLGILALLMSFGGLLINILTFLRKRK